MTSYWAPYAWLPGRCERHVRLTVAAGRFTEIRVGAERAAGDQLLHGVALPGLANGHSHAFHRALRGRTHGAGGTFWTWREEMYALAARLDPDSYRDLARAVFAEMTLAGYTAVGEFHYLHHDRDGVPYADPNAMGAALVEAATEVGIRLTLLDVCYLTGGLEAGGHLPLDPVQRRFADADADAWQARTSRLRPTDGVRLGVAAHSVRAVPAAALAVVAETASDLPLHIHLSEQPAENLACERFYGRTPAQLLAEAGVLDGRTTAVHATHVPAGDIALLGGSQTSVCFCPTTEADLADGIGPAPELAQAGSLLTLGSDQHALIDPFAELRGLELQERLRSGERSRFSPAELMTTASAAGYRSLGWEGGELVPGAPADFVVVRTDTVRTAGARPEQIGFAATAADVDQVVIGGRTIVADGEHHLGSPARLLAAALDRLDPA
jgi:formiminoglutamate deiminase